MHPTKEKGDLGVAKVHADLVAYANGEFHRLQVKYRSARAGAVKVSFRSMWADRHRTHTTPMDKRAIDVVCIIAPTLTSATTCAPSGTARRCHCESHRAGTASARAF
ncbi:MAG: group I intron-associated PD-(D/E)XK endonuclease [Actinomycetota bacterium]|nr:group I intron-associated PD-(D/E)XK endonuclease [Actinomycetota bacterium]